MAELIQQIDIEAPIDAVWAEITKLGSVQKPLLNTVLETTFEPGTPIRYRSANGKRTFVVGKIVEVQTPRLLSHTYVMTMYDDPPTLVTWTLDEHGPGLVRVTLKHEGWQEEGKTMDKHGKTWSGILADLKHQIETGNVAIKTRVSHALMTTFMFAMPAKTKSENVKVPE